MENKTTNNTKIQKGFSHSKCVKTYTEKTKNKPVESNKKSEKTATATKKEMSIFDASM